MVRLGKAAGDEPERARFRFELLVFAFTEQDVMQIRRLEFQSSFHVVSGNQRSQAAVMVLPPGETTGGAENRHLHSDQWLYVVSGEGEAVIDQQKHPLAAGTLLLIERGEAHEIMQRGDRALQTLSFYVPPAYSPAEGAPLAHD